MWPGSLDISDPREHVRIIFYQREKRQMRTLTSLLAAGMILAAGTALADEQLDSQAEAAMVAFTEAVASGNVAGILAPEYQIMRSNGIGYDRSEYIDEVKGIDIEAYHYDDIVATSADDIMVVRSILTINETFDGKEVERRAPRLTVFRLVDGAWKVVSHANFAQVGEDG